MTKLDKLDNKSNGSDLPERAWRVPAPTRRPVPRRGWIACWLLLAIVGGVLRGLTLGESLWLDELHTSWVVDRSFVEVAPRAAEGNQTPFFFWLTWFVVRLFGHSEPALRTVSWVAGSFLIFESARLFHVWTKSSLLATFVAILVLLDPHEIYFSREARPYALVQLLTIWHLHFFTRRLVGARHGRIGWVVTLVTLFYTHVTGCLIVLAELAFLVTTRWRRSWRTMRGRCEWLWDLSLAGLAIAGGIPLLRLLMNRRSNWQAFVREPDAMDLLSMFAWIPYGLVPLLFVAIMYGRRPEWVAWRRIAANGSFATLTGMWYWLPAGLTWTLTRLELAPLFFRRYLMGTAVAWLMLPAWLALTLKGHSLRCLSIALVVAASCMTHAQRTDLPYSRHTWEDWRGVVAWVQSYRESQPWPLLLRSGLIEDDQADVDLRPPFQDYLRFPLQAIYRLPVNPSTIAIVPRSGLRPEHLPWDPIQATGGCLLLARGTPSTVDALVSQLVTALESRGLSAELIAQHGNGRVRAFAFRVRPKELQTPND